jgi:hypothetical protein
MVPRPFDVSKYSDIVLSVKNCGFERRLLDHALPIDWQKICEAGAPRLDL